MLAMSPPAGEFPESFPGARGAGLRAVSSAELPLAPSRAQGSSEGLHVTRSASTWAVGAQHPHCSISAIITAF